MTISIDRKLATDDPHSVDAPQSPAQGMAQKWSPSAILSQISREGAHSFDPNNPSNRSSDGTSSDGHSTSSSSGSQKPMENQRELPGRFYDADPEDLFTLISDMLQQLTTHNDTIPLHPSDLTRFHSRAAPGISIGAYLRRLAKYTTLDKPCMLVVLIYIDRVCERMSGFTICSLTVHRFLCAAVVCATKALCDSFSTNAHYARVGGISLVEMNLLEKEFLNVIDWRLMVTAPVIQHYYTSLVHMHPSYTLGLPAGPMPTAFPAMVPGRKDP